MKPWYETVRRWGQTNLTEDDPLNCDLDFWREQWKRTFVQGVIVNAGGIVAYYPSRFALQHRAQGVNERDLFGEFSAAAKEAGLAVVARMDINRADKDFYDAHPDWFCVDQSGEPIISQGRYFSCVNSGYYTEYIPSVLREIIERYQPEGFSDNSWKGLGRNTICYCENCQNAFRAAHDLALPKAVDWDNPTYRTWVKWGADHRTKLWDLFNETTQKAGGPDCIWSGMLPADHHNLHGSLMDMYALCQRSKIIFCDHQSRHIDFEYNGMAGSLLRMASTEQILVPESMANYVRGERTFRVAANPALETQMWMVSGIAGGISPWYHHIGGNQHDRRQFETPIPIFEWHKDNEEYLYDREDLAQIGVVWSQESAELYGRGQGDKSAMPWRGFTQALTKARLPYLPINASDIKKYAPRLKTLILPDVALLNAEQLDAVCAFVQAGGGLVFSGATATLNSKGEESPENRLWKMVGLHHTGEYKGVSHAASENWEQYEAHNYLCLPPERHEILATFTDTRIIPFGGSLRVQESTGPLEAIAGYIPDFPIYPPEFSYIREECPELGTIFAGTLESGARVVYFAADIDRCLGRHGLPDHSRLLADATSWTIKGENPLTVEGLGYLDCRVFSQGSRVIVHIVNLSGSNRYGYCDEYYPVGPITVTVASGGRRFDTAKLAVAGETLKVEAKGGAAKVKLEKIGMHEVIVLS